jgi:hypothetical protein
VNMLVVHRPAPLRSFMRRRGPTGDQNILYICFLQKVFWSPVGLRLQVQKKKEEELTEGRLREIYERRGAEAARKVAVATRERKFITLVTTLAAYDQRPNRRNGNGTDNRLHPRARQAPRAD